ncbi:MAG: anti-sigma factor [Bordetella sp. SCN 67-23]|nr:anti-sigma factor [Burkholderiales bacterium]ODS73091.1 MAG: anti-sigma factor [Bordetella sp. SCN 67-23]OJW90904.1 MAG: anti-sigma factor [Burkholderiales bacterium 67-32]
MSTPASNDDELRSAEYALGVLDAAERRELERAASENPAIEATLQRWQQRFSVLSEDVAPVEPPRRVWLRIQRELGGPVVQPKPRTGHASWWDNLMFWRLLGFGATVVAFALLAINVFLLNQPHPSGLVAKNAYMVATIARQDGVAHWTATVDTNRGTLIVVPVEKSVVETDRSTELWLIPQGARPIPLGVFTSDQPASVLLTHEVVTLMRADAVIAVSIEPPGGSPTGQPTGPVVAKGAIGPV